MFKIVLLLVRGHRLISKVPVPSPPPELPEEPPVVVRSKEYRVEVVVE